MSSSTRACASAPPGAAPADTTLHKPKAAEGAEKKEASEQYLKDALTSFLEGRAVANASTQAHGCRITYARVTENDAVPDYASQVAPLLKQNCVHCHRQDGIGPWSMSSQSYSQQFLPAS